MAIRFTDASQESAGVRSVAGDVAGILTAHEEILYVALQNVTAMSVRPDAAVATTNRLVLYRPSVLGRVQFDDVQWQDVRNARIDQGVLSTTLSVDTVDGRTLVLADLDKDQAKRFYAISQQMEQEWREKRRVREMEESRARAGGVVMHAPPAAAAPAEDPVARLAKAKQMLDQGLISETEYDALKRGSWAGSSRPTGFRAPDPAGRRPARPRARGRRPARSRSLQSSTLFHWRAACRRTTFPPAARLLDRAAFSRVGSLAGRERSALVELIAHLAELDRRRLNPSRDELRAPEERAGAVQGRKRSAGSRGMRPSAKARR